MKKFLALGLFCIGAALMPASHASAASLGLGTATATKAAASETALVQVKRRGYHRHRSHRRGRNAAIGILGAAAAAAIISQSARADRRAYSRGSCRSLDYRCSRGSRRACYEFDNYC